MRTHLISKQDVWVKFSGWRRVLMIMLQFVMMMECETGYMYHFLGINRLRLDYRPVSRSVAGRGGRGRRGGLNINEQEVEVWRVLDVVCCATQTGLRFGGPNVLTTKARCKSHLLIPISTARWFASRYLLRWSGWNIGASNAGRGVFISWMHLISAR